MTTFVEIRKHRRWRTFVAIPLPEHVKRSLFSPRRSMPLRAAHAVRWSEPDAIHLTLRFLGDVNPRMIDEISKSLAIAANSSGKFKLKIGSPGGFPSVYSPRVLWVGISGETTRLKQLHGRIEGALLGTGFMPENRQFQPHLTIGRIQSHAPRGLDSLVGNYFRKLKFDGDSFRVSRIVLFRSHLHSTGARYEELFSAQLK